MKLSGDQGRPGAALVYPVKTGQLTPGEQVTIAQLRAEHRTVGEIAELLRRNGLSQADAWVRITVTRGVAAPGLLPPRPLSR